MQKAFYEGKLTVGHALEIARLQVPDQERAFAECFPDHRGASAVLKDRGAQATIPVRGLRQWIQREIHLDLSTAPFDTNNPDLLPAAGACSACPKRTGNNPILFPDIKKRDTCTDPACFRQKRDALVQLRVKELEGSGQKLVQVSESYRYYGFKPQPGVLHRDDYHEAKKGECPATVAAVMAEGKTVGNALYVCTDKQCKVHHPRVTISPEEREQRRNQAEAIRTQQSAYNLWMGSGSARARYRMSDFMRDWGPPVDVTGYVILDSESCGNSVIVDVDAGHAGDRKVWVDRANLSMSFPPNELGCVQALVDRRGNLFVPLQP